MGIAGQNSALVRSAVEGGVERTGSTEPQFLQAFWVLVENGRLVVLYHSTVLACPLRRISLDNGRPEPRPTGSAAYLTGFLM
jgi:hypothetical protein